MQWIIVNTNYRNSIVVTKLKHFSWEVVSSRKSAKVNCESESVNEI